MLLEIGREGEAGKPHEWSGERALVIGRGRNAEMMISDPLLSRRHCQLEMANGTVLVHDLGSANGTFINGIQATRAALAPGDVVTFGRSWLRIVPELAQVKIGGAPGDPQVTQTTRRFDKRAAPTSPERRFEHPPTDPDGEAYPPIDGYELFGTIGKGSFGTVYRAKNRASGRLAAIKVIPTGASAKAENVARFLREIEATGQLQHPNLTAVYGAGEGPHFAYLIMEYVEGDTLARVIQRDGKLEPARALEVGRQIAAGLEHAFSRGFVHRDVKPENILIDGGGTAKLCDFGLVKNLAASSGANLTRPGQGFGSLAYMPPEQVRDAARADQRADVYSLGATLYNALCGRRPFSGPVNKGFLRRVMEEYPDPIEAIVPGMPRDVITIVERCLQKDPALRYQSPRELREAIEACLRVASTGLEPALPALKGAATDKGGGSLAGAVAVAEGATPSRPSGEGTAIGTGAATEARAAASTPSAPSAAPSSASTTTNLPPYGTTSSVQPALVPAPSSLASGRLPQAPPPAQATPPPLGAPTPATPHLQRAVNPASGRLYSTSDSDAFDDFAKDLAPIPTDSNPVMRLSEAQRSAALAAGAAGAAPPLPATPGAPAPPPLAPSPAAELVLGLAPTPPPGEITRADVQKAGPPIPRTDPVLALFPGGDETRRTPTPPFLAVGKTGLPRRIESGQIPVAPEAADDDTVAPYTTPRPVDTLKAPHVPKGRAAEKPGAEPGGAPPAAPPTPPKPQGWPVAHPAAAPPPLAAGAPPALRGPSLGETLRAPPPAAPAPASSGANPFPETLRVPPPGGPVPASPATEARAVASEGAPRPPGTSPVSRDTDPALPPLVALPAKAPPEVGAEAPRKEGLLGKITKRLFKGRGKAALLLAGSLALSGAAALAAPPPPPDETSRDVDGRFLRMRLGGTPRGWKVERDDDLSRDAVAAIGSRLSLLLQRAAQAAYVVPQGRVALGTYLAPTADEARKLERALRRPKGPLVVRDDRGVFELESPAPAALEEVLAHLPIGPAARTAALDELRYPGSPIRRWRVEAHLVLLASPDAPEVRRLEALLAQASGGALSADAQNELARLAQKLGAGVGRTGPLCVPQTGKGTLARIDYAILEGEVETPRLDRSAPGKASLAATRRFPAEAPEVKRRLAVLNLPADGAARLAKVAALAKGAVEPLGDDAGGRDDPIAVLARGKGGPLERADVFVSLARAAGVAARIVHGVRVGPDGAASRVEWVEAHAGAQGWLRVDLDAGTTAMAPAELVPILLSEDGELPFAYAGPASVERVPRPPPAPPPPPPPKGK